MIPGRARRSRCRDRIAEDCRIVVGARRPVRVARDASSAIVLALVSWFLIFLVWGHVTPNGPADHVIATLMRPPYRVGRHLAVVVFPEYEIWKSVGYYLAPALGILGEVATLAGIWLGLIQVRRWVRRPYAW